MDDLAPAIREAQSQVTGICTECLRDAIAIETANLDELTAQLETVTATRQDSPDGECDYAEAVSELMATLIAISVFTAELTRRPAVVQVPLSTLN